MRRTVLALLMLLTSSFGLSLSSTHVAAQAPDPVDGYDLVRPPSECIGFLPAPDCGKPPTDAGERGGTLQYVTFAVILAGLAFIFTVVFRNVVRSDRAKASRAYAAEQDLQAVTAGDPDDPSRTPSSP